MTEILLLVSLILTIIMFGTYLCFREIKVDAERKLWYTERQQLLDRIMSRDFSEFKVLTEPIPQAEEEPPEIDDELGVNY
ncbi:MAG: hypothetical protein DDT19_00250 [Syntrophomonadaceae bacterium]|nr:hypothetical protein [Bacillota bacterium]